MALLRVKTSETDPIRVDFVSTGEGLGALGMTFAPGKTEYGTTAAWERNLDLDLERLRHVYRVSMLVTLLEDFEADELMIPTLVTSTALHGMSHCWYPFSDGYIPSDMSSFRALITSILVVLREKNTVVIHGRGGIRRTPLVTACSLIGLGCSAADALAETMRIRPGVDLTQLQREFIANFCMT